MRERGSVAASCTSFNQRIPTASENTHTLIMPAPERPDARGQTHCGHLAVVSSGIEEGRVRLKTATLSVHRPRRSTRWGQDINHKRVGDKRKHHDAHHDAQTNAASSAARERQSAAARAAEAAVVAAAAASPGSPLASIQAPRGTSRTSASGTRPQACALAEKPDAERTIACTVDRKKCSAYTLTKAAARPSEVQSVGDVRSV